MSMKYAIRQGGAEIFFYHSAFCGFCLPFGDDGTTLVHLLFLMLGKAPWCNQGESTRGKD